MKVTLPHTPSWSKARDTKSECGPHQIKAALAAHGIEKEIEELYISKIHRKQDWTLPWDASLLLARHGITSRLRFWQRGAIVNKILSALKRNHPVLLVILSTKSRCLHWVSVWGYEATTESFNVYDSQYDSSMGGHGNTIFSHATLLDALPWRGTFAVEVLD